MSLSASRRRVRAHAAGGESRRGDECSQSGYYWPRTTQLSARGPRDPPPGRFDRGDWRSRRRRSDRCHGGGSSPHVVVMDVAMPLLNGIEATRRIRASPKPPGADPERYDDQDYVRASIAGGANGYLLKTATGPTSSRRSRPSPEARSCCIRLPREPFSQVPPTRAAGHRFRARDRDPPACGPGPTNARDRGPAGAEYANRRGRVHDGLHRVGRVDPLGGGRVRDRQGVVRGPAGAVAGPALSGRTRGDGGVGGTGAGPGEGARDR